MVSKKHNKLNRGTKSKRGTKSNRGTKSKRGKRWVTAVQAAERSYKQTGSMQMARARLREQALLNARKLFGTK
tara:strand:+ start:275 stop:493 length:219 start_codon:yes stop_codon:yes gene_type:complete